MFSARWWRGDYINSNKQRSSGYSVQGGSHKGHIELESNKSSLAHIYCIPGEKHDDNSSSTEFIVQPKVGMGIGVKRDVDIT
jgi:hypothetical protein